MKVLSSMHDGEKFTLPPLPYAADAVSEAIDAETMTLHHDKHHKSYVDGLNGVMEELAAGKPDDSHHYAGIDRAMGFHYAGHVLHSIFWATMGPNSQGTMGGAPTGPIAAAIDDSFGSFDAFKKRWMNVAKTVKGSGWVQLLFDPVSTKLCVKGVADHDLFFMPGSFPLLPLDVWEHAYYLKYRNERMKYVEAYLNVIDWESVGALYSMVSAPYTDRRGAMTE